MNEQTASQHKDGHLVIYLAWPILAGLALGAVLAVSVGGMTLIKGNLRGAGIAAGVAFFVTFPLVAIGVFLYAAGNWAGPRVIERTRQGVIFEEEEPAPMVETPRPIVINPRRPLLTAPAPRLPEPGGVNRAAMRDVIEGIVTKRTPIPPAAGYDTEIESIEPDAPEWVIEFYAVLCGIWGKPLTRRCFEDTFKEGGQALYYKYVGSTNPSGAGLWQNWRIITQTGPRGSWEFCYDLETILKTNADVWQYAQARQRMIKAPSPTPPGGDRLTSENPQPNQTKPVNQNQTRGREPDWCEFCDSKRGPFLACRRCGVAVCESCAAGGLCPDCQKRGA